jgi:hypothetical protein
MGFESDMGFESHWNLVLLMGKTEQNKLNSADAFFVWSLAR